MLDENAHDFDPFWTLKIWNNLNLLFEKVNQKEMLYQCLLQCLVNHKLQYVVISSVFWHFLNSNWLMG